MKKKNRAENFVCFHAHNHHIFKAKTTFFSYRAVGMYSNEKIFICLFLDWILKNKRK